MDKKIIFKSEITADGSPTVRISNTNGFGESMHNLKGAYSETDYIYGHAVKSFLNHSQSKKISILSMGLGLGYIELLSLALILRKADLEDYYIRSYELLPQLRLALKSWIHKSSQNKFVNNNYLNRELVQIYESIILILNTHHPVEKNKFTDFFKKSLTSKKWEIFGPLSKVSQTNQKFNVICYDAFSTNTDNELWEESFLTHFIKTFAHDQCILATYASTGNLKRALKSNGFIIDSIPGFGGKRESLIASRNFTKFKVSL